MHLPYVVSVAAAVVLSTVAILPALIAAGVALTLAFRNELLTAGGRFANLRAPRPAHAVRRTPAKTDLR